MYKDMLGRPSTQRAFHHLPLAAVFALTELRRDKGEELYVVHL
jgi:hypothetical protein